MSAPHCAALLAIATCIAAQGLGLTLQWRAETQSACLQRNRQALVCLHWAPTVETAARAG